MKAARPVREGAVGKGPEPRAPRRRPTSPGGCTANSPPSASRSPPSTVWEILKTEGIDPAPQRSVTTWAGFLRSQAETLPACDFIETVTLTGQRQYILAVIEHANRRIRILDTTAHPTAGWVAQAIKNLVMDLENASCRARYLIRDRDGKFPALIDEILAD
ncbi:hypothetical protein ABZ321_55215, partial [Dactylosporangium sp. NPDC006015]